MSGQGLVPRTPSASERLRARWRQQLAWGGVIAVVVHAAVFAFTPGWEVSRLLFDRPDLESSPLVMMPYFGESSLAPGRPAAPTVVPGEAEGTDEDLGVVEGAVVTDASSDELWEALGERLRRGEGLRPTIAEPQTVAEEATVEEDDARATQDEGELTIGGDAIAADLVELPEPDSLSLDRLSALRPELAFMSASAWVLIRNQAEVEAFLRRGYLSGQIDSAASGSVSVTLWIDQRGSVEWAEISKSSGDNDLDEFALALFNEVATFRAARERGVYISRSVTFSVNFPW